MDACGILSDKPISWAISVVQRGCFRFIFRFHLGHGQKLDHSHWMICGVEPLSAHIYSCSLKNDDPEKDSKTSKLKVPMVPSISIYLGFQVVTGYQDRRGLRPEAVD